MKRCIGPLLVLIALAYPFAVYYGSGQLSPRFFAILLGVMWLVRLLTLRHERSAQIMALAALGFCAALLLFDHPDLLHWYPVLMNGGFLLLFAISLYHGMPVAERLARLREPELPPQAVRYTRNVTRVWALFFFVNGTIAAALTLWAPRPWWLLYNGMIAYVLMGLLFAGEWLLRQRIRHA